MAQRTVSRTVNIGNLIASCEWRQVVDGVVDGRYFCQNCPAYSNTRSAARVCLACQRKTCIIAMMSTPRDVARLCVTYLFTNNADIDYETEANVWAFADIWTLLRAPSAATNPTNTV